MNLLGQRVERLSEVPHLVQIAVDGFHMVVKAECERRELLVAQWNRLHDQIRRQLEKIMIGPAVGKKRDVAQNGIVADVHRQAQTAVLDQRTWRRPTSWMDKTVHHTAENIGSRWLMMQCITMR